MKTAALQENDIHALMHAIGLRARAAYEIMASAR